MNGTIDLAGKVIESADSRFKEGDSVVVVGSGLSEVQGGGFYVNAHVPGKCVAPMPLGLTEYQAMTFGTAGITTALAVIEWKTTGRFPQGDPSSFLPL